MVTLLIVEDNPGVRQTLRRIIEDRYPYVRIITTELGKRALRVAREEAIDIFIIDIHLSDMDGFELAKELRKTYRHAPIIIESSIRNYKFESNVHAAIRNIAFLIKPYSARAMMQYVQCAMETVRNGDDEALVFKRTGESRIYMVDRIIYIERLRATKRIHVVAFDDTNNCVEDMDFYGVSLNAVLRKVNDNRKLCRCHHSFIVNPNAIKRIDIPSRLLYLRYMGQVIPYSRTYECNLELLNQGGLYDVATS